MKPASASVEAIVTLVKSISTSMADLEAKIIVKGEIGLIQRLEKSRSELKTRSFIEKYQSVGLFHSILSTSTTRFRIALD